MSSTPRILVTAGPTREPIDEVRFISNRSSGRLGMAIVRAAEKRRLPTTLLAGPMALDNVDESSLTRVLRFQTTDELGALLRSEWADHDIVVMAAAVADFRPRSAESGKLGRCKAGIITLELVPTPDLLASMRGSRRPGQLIVGFALDSESNLRSSALRKLTAKGLDAIVANPLETMEGPTVEAVVLFAGGGEVATAGPVDKGLFGDWLIELLVNRHALGQSSE